MPETLHEGLDTVVPARGNLRALDRGHEHGAQVVLLEELALLVREVPAVRPALREGLAAVGGAPEAIGRAGHALVSAVEHQAGDLLDAELGGKILRPFQGGPPPVFIDVEFAVAV